MRLHKIPINKSYDAMQPILGMDLPSSSQTLEAILTVYRPDWTQTQASMAQTCSPLFLRSTREASLWTAHLAQRVFFGSRGMLFFGIMLSLSYKVNTLLFHTSMQGNGVYNHVATKRAREQDSKSVRDCQ